MKAKTNPFLFAAFFSLGLHFALILFFIFLMAETDPLAGGGGSGRPGASGGQINVEIVSEPKTSAEKSEEASNLPLPTPSKSDWKVSIPTEKAQKIDKNLEKVQSANKPDENLLPRKKSTSRSAEKSSNIGGEGNNGGEVGPGSGAGPADGALNPVLIEIRRRIERAKRYPHLAEQSGFEGKSLVHFKINDQGRPENVFLKTSSGFEVLDQEALDTIRRAAPYPVYPNDLDIWIHFEMGELF